MDASLCRFESCSGHISFKLMEVGLFSRCIKELIVDLGQVAVPHLGIFSTELVGASYSDKLTTINPPYYRVSFRKKDVDETEGTLFLDKIAETVDSDLEQAHVELNWCISRICSELEGNKICHLPGLGLMKADSKNEFFFICSEETELYPEGVELDSISIKKRPQLQPELPQPEEQAEEQPQQDSKLQNDAEIQPGQQSEPQAKEPIEPQVEEMSESQRHGGRTLLYVFLAIIGIAILGALVLYLTGADMSHLLDRMLYSREELELLGR